MLVLGIETSTEQTAVALGTEQGIVAGAMLAAARPGGEMVIPAIEHLLAWSNVSLSSLGGIAVGLGPGLFTGMRVGLARVLVKKGRIAEARRELESVLGETGPSNPADWTVKDAPQARALLATLAR